MNKTQAVAIDASRREFDQVIQDIADYVMNYDVTQSHEAMQTARIDWMDSIGCGLLALDYPACTRLLGPVVPGASLSGGARVPGTSHALDPVRAAWNIGAMIRWLDFNDTWLAAEWGHPSDNLGAILALADFQSRQRLRKGKLSLTMKDVLVAMIKAHEIQGVIALQNSFNRVGLDHVMLVRIASSAVTAQMLGCSREQIMNAISHAWIDGCSLRTYRHAPNTGSRKSWAAGDATSRGLFLTLLAKRAEMGCPTAISAPVWGFQDVLFGQNELKMEQGFGTYVMENILFKISYPAEFHAQTAVEAAISLHPQVKQRLDQIRRIDIQTQQSANRIINKTGKLDNPADRDHCLQYMVAVALIKGSLSAEDYEDEVANDPRIDQLRMTMNVSENAEYTRDYNQAEKRSIANAIQVFFKDASCTEKVEVHYPVGHRRRRDEGVPMLHAKFEQNLRGKINKKNADNILQTCHQQDTFEAMPVSDMMALLARSLSEN